MAEPAWVLRAQRMRRRRTRSRGVRLFWPQRNPILAEWLRRLLPTWLVGRFLAPLWRLLALTQTHNTARAAFGARAVLDGNSIASLDNWPRQAVPQYSDPHAARSTFRPRLTLRYAGHM